MNTLPLIDEARLWSTLMELAEIGSLGEGGVCRLAASEEDGRGRDLFAHWCKAAGLSVRVDRIGNMYARRAGRDSTRPPVLIGSHLDTQPTGGRFDGMFGVLAGLEIVRTLDAAGRQTEAPLEIVNWTNEEGCRFQPSSLGAEVAAGNIALDQALAARDENGFSLGDSLRKIGYLGSEETRLNATAYLEAHIEQGPILEAEHVPIGAVQGSMGIKGMTVVLTGKEAHTGTTPISERHDALFGAALCITRIRELALAFEPLGRASVARIQASPNARSVVAGKVTFTADCRHQSPDALETMLDRLGQIIDSVSKECGLQATVEPYWQVSAKKFDATCIAAVEQAAAELGVVSRRMVSGAGHDAIPISEVVPTAMIFVPSKGGVSHHPSEYTSPAELAAGCNVLLRAAVALADGTVDPGR